MDVAAEKATELPKLGKPRIKLNTHTSQTGIKSNKNLSVSVVHDSDEKSRKDEPARIGERHRSSTLCRNLEPGTAPSRLKAYIIRELDVTEKALPSVQRQNANVNTDAYGDGPSLTRKRASPR